MAALPLASDPRRQRRVGRLRLRLPQAATGDPGRPGALTWRSRVEDALRCADLGSGQRLVLLRRLQVAGGSASAPGWSAVVQAACHAAAQRACHGSTAAALRSEAVWFADWDEAMGAWLDAMLQGGPAAAAWFWPGVARLAGWGPGAHGEAEGSTGGPRREAAGPPAAARADTVRRLLARWQLDPASQRAVQRWLAQHPGWLTAPAPPVAAAAAEPPMPPGAGRFMALPSAAAGMDPAAQAAAGAPADEPGRPPAAGESPPAAAARPFGERVAPAGAPGQALGPPHALTHAVPGTAASLDRDTAGRAGPSPAPVVARSVGSPDMLPAGHQPPRGAGAAPASAPAPAAWPVAAVTRLSAARPAPQAPVYQGPATDLAAPAAGPMGPATSEAPDGTASPAAVPALSGGPAAASGWQGLKATQLGGLALCLNALERLGWATLLEDWCSRHAPSTSPEDQGLRAWAASAPWLAAWSRLPPLRRQALLRDPATAAWPVAELLPATPPAQAEAALLAGWRAAPAALRALGRHGWCRLNEAARLAGWRGARSLLWRPAWLQLSATHLDLVLPLQQVDLSVRRLGLDCDPGWLPWFGRIVQLHYEPDDRLPMWPPASNPLPPGTPR